MGWNRRLIFLLGALLLISASGRAMAQCTGGPSISQWNCWEQTISSNVNFWSGGSGNPYRDLILRVTFTDAVDGRSFTQDAFWLGDTTNSTTVKNFKVRTALPVGNWTWQVAGCTGVTGGQDCSTGVTWTPSSGPIAVIPPNPIPSPWPQLYSRGFPTQNCRILKSQPPVLVSCPAIVYGDQVTPFFWVGDTAWSAPAIEIDAQLHPGTFTQQWSQYLATRTPDGPSKSSYQFTAILVSPADNFSKNNDPDVFFAQPMPPCTVPASQVGSFPNDCSIPKPAYWNAFDVIVSKATQQDLLLMIGGLVHPFDTTPYPKYPSLNNVTHFSRYLAARMAGFAVMFSPGFDMPLSTTAVDGNTLSSVMDASGLAVQAASPRVLITNHLNGQATCTDYEGFGAEGPWPKPWMTSYFFQSGHAISPNGTVGTVCPGFLSSESAVQAAMRRAIQIPSMLPGNSRPLPSVNGEGPYDEPANDNPPNYAKVNMRYRIRQAANLSSLSGAQGFTYGVPELGLWTTPASYWGLPSVVDMQKLADRFRSYPGLPTHSTWIVNNPASYDQQMALASDGSTIAIAYLPPANPGNPQINSITLSTSGLPGLGCPGSSPWTLTWETPTTNATQPVPSNTCTTPAAQIQITSPPCTPQALASTECDWILLMTKTGPPAPAAAQSAQAALARISHRRDGKGLSPVV